MKAELPLEVSPFGSVAITASLEVFDYFPNFEDVIPLYYVHAGSLRTLEIKVQGTLAPSAPLKTRILEP